MPSIQQLPTKRVLILDCALSSPKFSGGRIISSSTAGDATETVLANITTLPDGIALDADAGHMYITHMGTSLSSASGFITRYNLDGSDAAVVIPQGSAGVWTPKQIAFVHSAGRKWVYWCDREGMKLMRACVDRLPATPEVLLETGVPARDGQKEWCVGVAVDAERDTIYWSQKGRSKGSEGRIFRANVNDVKGTREVLFEGLPEPIDLEFDAGWLYWTDRGDPPRGNSLNRAEVGEAVGGVEVLATRFHEAIGLALDREQRKCYVSDLAGGVYEVDIESGRKTVLFPELGDLTGIALVEA